MNAFSKQLRSSVRQLCTISLLVFVLLQAGGCSVTLFVVGAISDETKQGFGRVDSTEWSEIEKDHTIQAELMDEAVIEGKFRSLKGHSNPQHVSQDDRARAAESLIGAPLPSTLVLAQSMWLQPFRGKVNENYRHLGINTTYIPVSEIREIRYPNKRQAGKMFLYGLVVDVVILTAVAVSIGSSMNGGFGF